MTLPRVHIAIVVGSGLGWVNTLPVGVGSGVGVVVVAVVLSGSTTILIVRTIGVTAVVVLCVTAVLSKMASLVANVAGLLLPVTTVTVATRTAVVRLILFLAVLHIEFLAPKVWMRHVCCIYSCFPARSVCSK